MSERAERRDCLSGAWSWLRHFFKRRRSAKIRPHERATIQDNIRSRSLTEQDFYCRFPTNPLPKALPRKRFLDSSPEDFVKVKLALDKEMKGDDFNELPLIKIESGDQVDQGTMRRKSMEEKFF